MRQHKGKLDARTRPAIVPAIDKDAATTRPPTGIRRWPELHPTTQAAFNQVVWHGAVMDADVAIIPPVALALFMQRFWRLDPISGGVEG